MSSYEVLSLTENAVQLILAAATLAVTIFIARRR
jgi:hypothetical protein